MPVGFRSGFCAVESSGSTSQIDEPVGLLANDRVEQINAVTRPNFTSTLPAGFFNWTRVFIIAHSEKIA